MNLNDTLSRFLFIHARNTVPDGRPLYAYKCRKKDYDRFETAMQEMLPAALRGSHHVEFSALFCLYAAESWRRKHSGGVWKWETVFSDVCVQVPAHTHIVRWVREGLRYWRRPILQSRTGTNEYLVTIACEGGLPLLLLQREGAHLYRYFKSLLNSYHQERNSPYCDAVAIAARLSSYLPSSLRHDIVFKLGGALVKKTVELQEAVAEAADPIQALDARDKSWRDLLPLPLEDSTVELLLKNLVKEAQALAITERQRIRWRRRLIWVGGTFSIEQHLEMPNALTGATLRQWIGRMELPVRMKLLHRTAKGTTPVALITLLRGEGANAIYRCEVLKHDGVRMSGERVLRAATLILGFGNEEAVVPVHRAGEWGPLPWVFAQRDGQWELIGEGSVRCKDETVHVLFPPGGRTTTESGVADTKEHNESLHRELWEVSGVIVWHHDEMGTCRIRCANADAEEVGYTLEGKTLTGTADQTPPYRGVPGLYTTHALGGIRLCEDAIPEWRLDRPGEKVWRSDVYRCAGRVWLRWANTDGEQLLCRRLHIVPADAVIEMVQVGAGQKPGRIRLEGFLDAAVSVGELAGGAVCNATAPGKIEIDCFADAGLPQTQFPVNLYWPDGRSLEMQLPFPREGAAFTYAGESLAQGSRVPVEKLAGIQAVYQATSIARRFSLEVKIKTDGHRFRNQSIRRSFSVDDKGRGSFQLHHLQDRIASMLALTSELDSIATLEIVDQANRSLAYLEVGQFDMAWQADRDRYRLRLPANLLDRLETGWQARLKARMVPLWDPTAEPVFLENGEICTEWIVPENLSPGRWWVLGEDGDWARFRPLLWVIAGDPEYTESPLKWAILNDDRKTREDLLRRWVTQVSETPDHPDWILFFSYLDLMRPYPACALDFLCHFVRSPKAMVMALLQSSDESFDAVWSLSYQLPFSWYLVPVSAWLSSAIQYFTTHRLALAQIDAGDDILWDHFQAFRDRVTAKRPFFRQICDWLCPVLFPERTIENSELAIAQRCPETIGALIMDEEQKFQGRHGAEEMYPEGPETMRIAALPDFPEQHCYRNLSDPFRPVRCAPFVAAHISLYGKPYNDAILFELKRLRDFDREWFTLAYAFALCLGLVRTSAILCEDP